MSLALGSAEQGNSERAMALFAESLALARVEGDDDHAAWALINLAELSADRTDFALAETSCRQAMQILKRHGGESVDALVLGVEGYVALKRGEYGQAATRMSAAIRALHALGNRKYAILNLERLASAAEGQHQLARAAQFLAAGENLRRTLGVPRAPAQQAKVEQLRALLHGRLGEAEFDAAWTAGCAMSLDQAIAFASEGTTRDPARLDGSAQAVGGP
jgi:tetratricopeptide (TPR) repeat protein